MRELSSLASLIPFSLKWLLCTYPDKILWQILLLYRVCALITNGWLYLDVILIPAKYACLECNTECNVRCTVREGQGTVVGEELRHHQEEKSKTRRVGYKKRNV